MSSFDKHKYSKYVNIRPYEEKITPDYPEPDYEKHNKFEEIFYSMDITELQRIKKEIEDNKIEVDDVYDYLRDAYIALDKLFGYLNI